MNVAKTAVTLAAKRHHPHRVFFSLNNNYSHKIQTQHHAIRALMTGDCTLTKLPNSMVSNDRTNYTPFHVMARDSNLSYLKPRIQSEFSVHFRSFSSLPVEDKTVDEKKPIQQHVQIKEPGRVTKTLRVLDMDVVKKIIEELREVDVNHDGRIDTEELKTLLRRHQNAFTEEEIVEIGEFFYAGKSGGSVPIDRFIEAIDLIVQREGRADIPQDAEGNPLQLGQCGNEYLFYKSHGKYTDKDFHIEITHKEPKTLTDKFALKCTQVVRFFFDKATQWDYGNLTTDKVLNRTIYLETIAAVPGMVAAIVRHFKSLRSMQRDGGMMQMFLDEANNERMHLLTFVRMKNPSKLFRASVILGQFGFGSAFLAAYLISPKFCHRFVGYVEEEACTTYTKIIHAIETAPPGSELATWQTQVAPAIARSYWHLGENGTVLQLFYAVRADEAEHRDVNHICSGLPDGKPNPVSNTEQKLNTMLFKYVKDLMERSEPDGRKIQQQKN